MTGGGFWPYAIDTEVSLATVEQYQTIQGKFFEIKILQFWNNEQGKKQIRFFYT